MMSESKPPMPVIKKMRWPFPVIWIIPIIAACSAGYYLRQHHQETGTHITIQFDDGAGIRPGETTVTLHGVTIGHVKTVEVSSDHIHATAQVQLMESATWVLHTNTQFWVVRPELSLQNVSGLNTLVSGPYIDCRPGDGAATDAFVGLPGPPMVVGPGIRIILSADQISQLSVDSPVNYRGIQVGVVKDIRLSSTAESVNVTIFIWERYKSLVRSKSEFWMIKGADLQGSIFSGLSLKLGSVQNILTGGVSFATPEKDYGNLIADGARFELHDQIKDEWLKWKAQIQLPPDATSGGDQKSTMDAEKKQIPGMQHDGM